MTAHTGAACPRWWETAAAMTRPYLKARRRTLRDLGAQLDTLRAQGFDAIEVFAPCAGGTCYNGLDTIDFYRVDPALGTMDDFKELIAQAHARDMAIAIFINLGYTHEYFPAFLAACDDVRIGVDSPAARMFVWSETGTDTMDRSLAPHFLNDARGHWRWSERAQRYFWVKWEGERGGYHLPQLNWGDPGWQAEARRILEFWIATGIDGAVIDAVNWYVDADWRITRASMTDPLNAAGLFSQPEGGGGFQDDPVPWIAQGGFTSVMDYAVKLWWKDVDLIRDAIVGGDPRPIEAALRGYRDRVVAAGGVCYIDAPTLTDASPAARLLGAAAVATIGELFLDVDGDVESWPDDYRRGLAALLDARRRYPALCAAGTRTVLPASDAGCYAFVRTGRDGDARVLVALNFRPQAREITIDLEGQGIGALTDILSGGRPALGDNGALTLALSGYGYNLFEIAPRGDRH